MAWHYDNLDAFKDDVDRISTSVRTERYNAALDQWKLMELFNTPEFPEQALMSGFYKYQPQQRLFVAADPTPMTCESDPQAIDTRTGEPISVRIKPWELKYDLCHADSCTMSLEDTIAVKEFAVGTALGNVLFTQSWYGLPQAGTFGLFTHPLTSVTATATPDTPVPGQTNWQSKSANEIFTELQNAMLGMVHPRLAISEAGWNAGASKIFGDGTQCGRLADCLMSNLQASETTGQFAGRDDLFILKYLNDVEIGGAPSNDAYIVWDDDSVEFPFEDIHALTAIANKKRLDLIRSVKSAGTIVKYANSVRVVTGINEVIT